MPKEKIYNLLKKELELDEMAFKLFFFLAIGGLIISGIISRESKSDFEKISDKNYKYEKDLNIPSLDTSQWKEYRSYWYGFYLKYPANWNEVQFKESADPKSEIIYEFRNNDENNPFRGFDIVVYNKNKASDVFVTSQIATKSGVPEYSYCQNKTEMDLGEENIPAIEIRINKNNPCYKENYFYSVESENYIFNIIPFSDADLVDLANYKNEIIRSFPEYFSAVSSFEFREIVRKPKITARYPVSASLVGGKLVCAKENDKPRKSKKTDKKHLDLQCCLDPDEYPNPWCTY